MSQKSRLSGLIIHDCRSIHSSLSLGGGGAPRHFELHLLCLTVSLMHLKVVPTHRNTRISPYKLCYSSTEDEEKSGTVHRFPRHTSN